MKGISREMNPLVANTLGNICMEFVRMPNPIIATNIMISSVHGVLKPCHVHPMKKAAAEVYKGHLVVKFFDGTKTPLSQLVSVLFIYLFILVLKRASKHPIGSPSYLQTRSINACAYFYVHVNCIKRFISHLK